MEAGYIRLHRKIRGHWIWENAEYLKWWIDLLLLANFQQNKLLINGKLTVIEIGEHHTSELILANRWYVNRKTVKRFLELLENDGMISIRKNRASGTTLKILNYPAYQAFFGIKKDNERDNERDINKKENHENHEKELKDLFAKKIACAPAGMDGRTKNAVNPPIGMKHKIIIEQQNQGKQPNNVKRRNESNPVNFGNESTIRPTVEEIAGYCAERGNGLSARRIYDHYEAAGWMRGTTRIRDWKACVRTWEPLDNGAKINNDRSQNPDKITKTRFSNFKQHERNFAEIERKELERLEREARKAGHVIED